MLHSQWFFWETGYHEKNCTSRLHIYHGCNLSIYPCFYSGFCCDSTAFSCPHLYFKFSTTQSRVDLSRRLSFNIILCIFCDLLFLYSFTCQIKSIQWLSLLIFLPAHCRSSLSHAKKYSSIYGMVTFLDRSFTRLATLCDLFDGFDVVLPSRNHHVDATRISSVRCRSRNSPQNSLSISRCACS